jgi:hypothetical protein
VSVYNGFARDRPVCLTLTSLEETQHNEHPDLPRRLQLGAALNEPDPTTFYGGDAAGYTTYPTLSLEPASPVQTKAHTTERIET